MASSNSPGLGGTVGDASPKNPIESAEGEFRWDVTIEVPAFHGIEPNLTLRYSSNYPTNDERAFLGVGWHLLGVSQIQRASAHWGAPDFTSGDVYKLDQAELVACVGGMTSPSCTTGGSHATRMESYKRISQNSGPNTWTVTEPDGTQLTYAPLSTWTTYNQGDPNAVNLATHYRWMLQMVADTHGNSVTYSYWCDGLPNCYVNTIAYNGTTITFYRESRSDPVTYAAGAGLGQWNFRIKTIDISAGGSRLRTYALAYTAATGTGRSTLASVQEYGRDAVVSGAGVVSGGTALPPELYSYQAAGTTFTSAPWAGTVTTPGGPGGWVAGDYNGDGRTDYAHVAQYSCNVSVLLSTGSSFTQQTWTVGGAGCQGLQDSNAVVEAGDFNGDGKTDLLTSWKPGPASLYDVSILMSTGSGFTNQLWLSNLSGASGASPRPVYTLGDFNGDGKTDARGTPVSSTDDCPAVFISTGSGFQTSLWNQSSPPCADSADPGDFDGDGKTDVITIGAITGNGSGSYSAQFTLLRSTGTSFEQYTGSLSVPSGLGTGQWLRMDVNGDGKTDLVFAPSGGVGSGDIVVYLSTGHGFVEQTLQDDAGTCGSQQCIVGDFNGDGRSDLAFADSTLSGSQSITTFISNGSGFAVHKWSLPGWVDWNNNNRNPALVVTPAAAADFAGKGMSNVTWLPDQVFQSFALTGSVPDLLTGVTGRLGATTAVTYTPSAQWTNTNLPFVTQTVSGLSVNDGRGNISNTSIAYAGGLWNAPERRFLGFQTATATLPCNAGESACPTRKTTYLQSIAADPIPQEVDNFDGLSNLLNMTVDTFTLNTSQLPYTALDTGTQRTVQVGSSSKTSGVNRTFDAYGNVIQVTELGDINVSGDERTTAATFEPNTSAYLVAYPAQITKYVGTTATGTPLSQRNFLYDGAASYVTPPVKGDATKVQDWLDQTNSLISSTATYNTYGNLTAATDPLGNTSQFTYDSTYHLFITEADDPLHATDPRHKVTATWDFVCGEPLTVTDENGQNTVYSYDPLCRQTNVALSDGGFQATSYNNLGNPATQYIETDTPPADGSGNLWGRAYLDGFGRTYHTLAKGPAANQNIAVDATFTPRGSLYTKTAPYYPTDALQTTTFTYDDLDRPTKALLPDSNQVQKSYGIGAVFEKNTFTDELGRPTTTQTDAYGRVVRVDKTLNGSTVSTSYSYDMLDRLTGLTDAAGNHWTYTYDSLDRKLTASDPDLGNWSYQYDAANRMTQQADSLGQITKLTYDALNRVLTRTARYGTGQADTTTYTYDEARSGAYNVGQQTTAANSIGTCQYNYDKLGRLISQSWIVDGQTYTETTGYDTGGRQLWLQYPSGDQIGTPTSPWTYDGSGELLAIPSLISNVTYNARGEATQLTRVNGVVTNYSYSAARGWLLGLTTQKGASTLQNLGYTRDARGRITASSSDATGESWTYGYDDFDRLTQATNSGSSLLNQSFAYDSIDNMTSNSAVGTYTYPLPGAARPHAVQTAGSTSYGYDADGNMIAAGGDSFTYDGLNRLTLTHGTSFVYGPDGARWKKIAAGGTTLYLGDDIEIAGGVATLYLPGDAVRTGGVTSWLHRDNLGSVRLSTDGTGAVTQRAFYLPYGERQQSIASLVTSKGYIGERNDPETGLLYLHARYYDPHLARFITADPSDPSLPGVGINRYAYAGDSPITGLDPYGACVNCGSGPSGAGRPGSGGGSGSASGPSNQGGGNGGRSASNLPGWTGIQVAFIGRVEINFAGTSDAPLDPNVNEMGVPEAGDDGVLDGALVPAPGTAFGNQSGDNPGAASVGGNGNVGVVGQQGGSGSSAQRGPAGAIAGGNGTAGSGREIILAAGDNGVLGSEVGGEVGGIGPVETGVAGESTDEINNYNQAVEQAKKQYPGKATIEQEHHKVPKYLGGDPNGPTVKVNGAYHQIITNAFRQLWKYGQNLPNPQQLEEILKQVYGKFPLPPTSAR